MKQPPTLRWTNWLKAFISAWVMFAALLSLPAQAQTVTHFHNDISGTPMLATDAAGNVVWKENHRPYGERVLKQAANNNSTNKIGFAGKPFDDQTGLSYMGARYYNPVIGRFMGVDPVGFQENNIHSFNRYAYANNNPYKYVDPDGRTAKEWFSDALTGICDGATLGLTEIGRAHV